MPHLFISAAHKSSGKTTISLGLCAALTEKGLKIRPFKKGPDYIDPMWLGKAAGFSCHNLDFNNMTRDEIVSTFNYYSKHADISLIEGNKGLYDGLDIEGSNSNAALAKLLLAPIVLVIDARGMTRGIAPLILGYQQFDPEINIAGVILNQIGGSRHEAKLRAVINHYTNVPVLGAVHRDPQLEILERHLGLIPSNEEQNALHRINEVGKRIADQVDLQAIIAIADNGLISINNTDDTMFGTTPQFSGLRIAIARDAAFGFYYPGDLAAFEQAGVEIIYFDTLNDPNIPRDIDGLFIGGGFPETQALALQHNLSMRESIKAGIENGLPVYAECGGLMYLTRDIVWKSLRTAMVGAIPADTLMHDKPQGRGYVRLRETLSHPWNAHSAQYNTEIAAHEFHYSSLENIDKTQIRFAYEVLRGHGVDGHNDGVIYKNVLGSYTHLRDVHNNHWVSRFLQFVKTCKNLLSSNQQLSPGIITK